MKYNDKPLGKKIGVLPEKEKKILIGQLDASLKNYKIGMIFAVLSIVIIIGIIITPSFYYVIIKLNKKLRKLQTEDIDIYEMSGVLKLNPVSRGPVSSSSLFPGGSGYYTCMIDGILVPGAIVLGDDKNGIKGFVGAKINFQYLPQITMNRQFSNEDGQGYNFITKTILTSS